MTLSRLIIRRLQSLIWRPKPQPLAPDKDNRKLVLLSQEEMQLLIKAKRLQQAHRLPRSLEEYLEQKPKEN